MASWFDSFFSGGNWIPAALLGTAVVAGAAISSRGNTDAARIAAQSSQMQAAAVQQGNQLAQQRYEEAKAISAPAVARAQQIVNQGTDLTADQQAQVADARRATTNALQVSPLRGSGRATVAAIRKVEGDLTNQLISQNRARADQATSTLANQYFAANSGAANLDANTGQAVGQAINNAGMTNAGATVANANLRGQALGDIGTIINDAWKESRRSSYGTDQARKPGEDDPKKLTMAGAQ